MRLRAWIAGFRWLHEKARGGALPPEEAQAYQEAREDLAAMLVAAQRLTLNPGQTAREALRVVRILPLELHHATGPVRAETLDISTGGFSAVLSRAMQPDEAVEFSLRIGTGPVRGRAKVANIQQQGAAIRVSFRIEGLSPADVERMGSEVMDAALEQLAILVEAT
ncbi:MAG: PilZ domain-containing protein [Myxococcales bacterium]|nr:PilZ domain-containing protein [Myxococcales bacterium]